MVFSSDGIAPPDTPNPGVHRPMKGIFFMTPSSSLVKTSWYPLRHKMGAAQEMLIRIRERWPDDPGLAPAVEPLKQHAARLEEAYAGIDATPATEDVQIADENRDAAVRALHHYLKALLYSQAHRETWEAASDLLRVLAGDGLGWIQDAYIAQTIRLQEILGKLREMEPQIEACKARVFVEQVQESQAFFEEKQRARAGLLSEKPDTVMRLAPAFERSLRLVLTLLENRPADADRAYVLEPFTRLQPTYAPRATPPAPPQA